MSKINLIIRGHVRYSFTNPNLYNLIKLLSNRHEIEIFCHTWNKVQNNLSWRRLENIEHEVNEETILKYFADLRHLIKHVMIDDDKSIQIIGKKDGFICSTRCPVLGYKNMYYGMLRVAEHVYKNKNHNEAAIQIRFDILQNSFGSKFSDFLNFCDRPLPKERKIEFWTNERPLMGIDNFYMATVENMYKFIKYLYTNLDELNEKHRALKHQEYIAFFEKDNFS